MLLTQRVVNRIERKEKRVDDLRVQYQYKAWRRRRHRYDRSITPRATRKRITGEKRIPCEILKRPRFHRSTRILFSMIFDPAFDKH
ncbi:hypothetical protein CEXT_529631 [Caerostris extrusa]|uniref:Uncharacterized protein n=1 Tax=Caerostris extrusa TaxID=172846 RepID=A0AAV4Y805_CAEEX|nr:hypothetical protein CEXT_529631 [Caerostris extrusa]